MKTALTMLAILLVGLAALAIRSVQPAEVAPAQDAANAARSALTVTLVAPKQADWPLVVEASGGLFAWQEGVIAAETGGLRVLDIAVDVGDRVERGQELVRLDDATVRAELVEQDARVAQAKAALAEARANGERARTVKDSGAMSDQQITQYLVGEETAQANLAAAEAARETQRLRLAQTHILAVDDGLISARPATLGMVVQPGTELLRLVRQGRVEWRAEVTADQLAQIQPGQEAELTLPGGENLVGRVRVLAPTLDDKTRYGLVYVDLPVGGPARPGMFARGSIRLGRRGALTLPESAVVLRDGNSYVFVLGPDDRVAQRRVETGRRTLGQVEVLTGLEPDAGVVERGGAFLNDGDLVRVEAAAVGTPAGTTP
jgi:RND family efflux transporter MFP subunit